MAYTWTAHAGGSTPRQSWVSSTVTARSCHGVGGPVGMCSAASARPLRHGRNPSSSPPSHTTPTPSAAASPASAVALLHAGDGQGKGPYGLEVWQLQYSAK